MSESIMGLINPAIAAIFAAIFTALWVREKSDKGTLLFAVGHLLLACGFLVFHFTPDPNSVGSALFMHFIYCAASGCICWAAAKRVGQHLSVWTLAAIALLAAVMMVAGSFGTDMNVRLIAANTGYGLIFALTAQVVGRAGQRSPVDHAIFWLLVVTAIQFFIRPQVAIILGGPMSAEAYRASDFYAVLMLFMGIDSLLLAMSLVAACVFDQWRSEKEKSETDALSGLKMRRSFESSAMEILDANVDRDVSVCMIVADIDHFKRVNDIWGHQAGDDAIRSFGKLIGSTVRGTDLCGRIGGEEFCILVYDCEAGPATGLAERIRRKFAAMEHEALGPDIRITASFGVTQWRSGEGYGKLFARADAALYRAKSLGRDRVEDDSSERTATPAVASNQNPSLVELKRASAG